VLGKLTRSTTYRESLSELDQLLMQKLGDIGKAAHIARCILSGSEVTPHIDNHLREQRAAILEKVRAYMAEHHSAGKSKSGRKRKKRGSKQNAAS
jgi:hypothetical protein